MKLNEKSSGGGFSNVLESSRNSNSLLGKEVGDPSSKAPSKLKLDDDKTDNLIKTHGTEGTTDLTQKYDSESEEESFDFVGNFVIDFPEKVFENKILDKILPLHRASFIEAAKKSTRRLFKIGGESATMAARSVLISQVITISYECAFMSRRAFADFGESGFRERKRVIMSKREKTYQKKPFYTSLGIWGSICRLDAARQEVIGFIDANLLGELGCHPLSVARRTADVRRETLLMGRSELVLPHDFMSYRLGVPNMSLEEEEELASCFRKADSEKPLTGVIVEGLLFAEQKPIDHLTPLINELENIPDVKDRDDRVIIIGLIGRPDLNGMRGFFNGPISKERASVSLDGGELVSVKWKNMVSIHILEKILLAKSTMGEVQVPPTLEAQKNPILETKVEKPAIVNEDASFLKYKEECDTSKPEIAKPEKDDIQKNLEDLLARIHVQMGGDKKEEVPTLWLPRGVLNKEGRKALLRNDSGAASAADIDPHWSDSWIDVTSISKEIRAECSVPNDVVMSVNNLEQKKLILVSRVWDFEGPDNNRVHRCKMSVTIPGMAEFSITNFGKVKKEVTRGLCTLIVWTILLSFHKNSYGYCLHFYKRKKKGSSFCHLSYAQTR